MRITSPDGIGEYMEQLRAQQLYFQIFPNGFGSHDVDDDPTEMTNHYNGWNAVVGSSLQESLVQSYECAVRVAPAWPEDWDVTGSVQIEGGHRVSTEARDGSPSLVGIRAAADDTLEVVNPWCGRRVRVVDGDTGRGRPIVRPTGDELIGFRVEKGRSYLLTRADARTRRSASRWRAGSRRTASGGSATAPWASEDRHRRTGIG